MNCRGFNDWSIEHTGFGGVRLTLDTEEEEYARFELPKNVENFFFLGNSVFLPTIGTIEYVTYEQR